MTGHRYFVASLTMVVFWGCASDKVVIVQGENNAGSEMVDAPEPDDGDMEAGGSDTPEPGGEQPDEPEPNGGDDTPMPPIDMAGEPEPGPLEPDCNAYTFRDIEYNCSELDLCAETDFAYRLACCDCNVSYCNPPPGACQPEPDPGPDPVGPDPDPVPVAQAETCMSCHNGASERNDYSGQRLSNPHPFPPQDEIPCTGCHGGDGTANTPIDAHVPPPPEIAGPALNNIDEFLVNNPGAYFNRLSLAGVDKMAPGYGYPELPGKTFDPLDWLQFINPGDLRVVSEGRGCGAQGCHGTQHGEWVPRSVLANTNGLFSATRFTVGVDNRNSNYSYNTLRDDDERLANSDVAPRELSDPGFNPNNAAVGQVGRLYEQQTYSGFQGNMANDNPDYTADTLNNTTYDANYADNPFRLRTGSKMAELMTEQVSITCGNCHLYSAGDNNRYADYRSSGCTACHMEYSFDGRSRSNDPFINTLEPANADAIAAPERPHVEAHQIRNVAKILPNGGFVRGIGDRACVGCHQGSNRTVLQYWGIRLDQNQDLTNNFQYPQDPNNFQNAANDTRLYNPGVNNATFNGRVAEQHIAFEDYDNDNRDDSPPDLHHEAGLGCIDCHGSRDLHGGTEGDQTSGRIQSRQDQGTFIRCESCHGSVESYADTTQCTTYAGQQNAECAMDSAGNPLPHVTKDAQGHYYLISRLDGQRHYVIQTRDVVVRSNRTNPLTQAALYNPKASYAMGRADGNNATGTGPQQTDPALVPNNFSHMDNLDCATCHSSWTNNCIGCHLATQYNDNPNEYFFSNITGERILLEENAADFVYQSPVMMYLGINSKDKVSQVSPAGRAFWRYVDFNGDTTDVFAFGDRLGEGNNPAVGGRNAYAALSIYQMSPHSIRSTVSVDKEGPRYCVACHLNTESIANFGAQYDEFRTQYATLAGTDPANQDLANIDYALLQQHIGQNPGNQLNSPFFVHMAAGLGSALFLFDENGCPTNPLDDNADREFCEGNAPLENFANNVNDLNDFVKYDLDRIVEYTGITNSSGTHPLLNGAQSRLRGGSTNPGMAGPLGRALVETLADPDQGVVLDSWIDADGNAQGDAANFLQ